MQCANAAGGANGVLLNQASRINISNTTVASINKPGSTITAFNMSNCTQCSFGTLGINGNTASTLTLFSDNLGTGNVIQNTLVSTNTGSTVICYSLTGCSAESFINCTASSNQASGSLSGFLFASTSTANYLEKCLVSTNTGGSISGFSFSGSSSQNVLIDCSVLSNFANVANLFGIVVNNASFGILLRNNASYNFNTTANATAGINFQNPTIGVSWSVIDAITERNVAAGSAANSFGIIVGASANNLFSKNIAFTNFSTVGNQINGATLTAAVITPAAPATSNMASPTGPWSNLAITQ
ncbi:hypothetical protein HYX58_00160 [Candidatus Dependentiae bacterium]|nr:hypothetical protein [Candidatus Dependentiae bacterium]